MSSLKLPCLPDPSLILQPPSRLLNAYARLNDPVPDTEASLLDIITEESLSFRDGRKEFAAVNEETLEEKTTKRAKTTQPFHIIPELLRPITKKLSIKNNKLPLAVWSRNMASSIDNMSQWGSLFEKYEHVKTSGTYEKIILKNQVDKNNWGGIPLFGKEHNDLNSKLILASILKKEPADATLMILHYISIICLQFYLMERDRFLQLRTDRAFKFRESDQPYIFLLLDRKRVV